MLGALRDEVVPEVLGGRPADSEPTGGPQSEPVEEPVAEPAELVVPEPVEVAVAEPAELVVPEPDEVAVPEPDDPAAVQAAAIEVDVDAVADDAAGPVGDTGPVTSPAALAPPSDAAAAAAVELARAAAVDSGGRAVGEHVGAVAEDALTVTHAFSTTDPAYVGWHWAVTVARAEGSDVVTVDEVVLLPGPDALLAPAWVPYSDRLQPGDLGTGDLLPPEADDPRLVPAYADPGAELAGEAFWELGLGRPRVLSLEGRADAAERWYEGDAGPASPRAVSAPGACGGCGFLVPLGGALRAAFGACANAQAPDDGRVVALTHGCGAHSETPVELTRTPTADLVVDEVEYDFEAGHAEPDAHPDPDADVGRDADSEPDVGGADPLPDPADEDQAEELGHS